MTITATYSVENTAGVSQPVVDQLLAVTRAALGRWSAVLAGDATPRITITIAETTQSGRAQGGNETFASLGTLGGFNVFEPGTAYELRTGQELGQSGSDIHITVAKAYLLNEMFLDATPETRDDIPADRTDGLSVLTHEIGHALGFIGYYDEGANSFAFNAKTPYDTHVALRGGEVFFDGANVRAVYGDAIPLTNNNYTHYGNSSAFPGTSGDPLTGLMNGVVYYRGYRYDISSLDLAVMADNGVGTVRDDIFTVNATTHAFNGGAERDLVDFAAAGAGVTLSLATTAEQATGGAGAMRLVGVESVAGSAYGDRLTGDDGANVLKGGGGADWLDGGKGGDTLDGGADADVLVGGPYADRLTGGAGADVFRFVSGDITRQATAPDYILDFSLRQGDRIDLTGFDAVFKSRNVIDPFTFIGKAAFSGAAGELHYAFVDGHTILSGDTDGDKAGDFFIDIAGRVKLTGKAFVHQGSAPSGDPWQPLGAHDGDGAHPVGVAPHAPEIAAAMFGWHHPLDGGVDAYPTLQLA